MDSDEIRELIELISRSDFASFELERNGFKLRLVRRENASTPPLETRPYVHRTAAPASSITGPEPGSDEVARVKAEPVADGLVELHAPIVGTFYRCPSPGTPPFVEVGQAVKKGQVLCIIEAMKVMNEIESEIEAEVMEVLVANGQPVEYGEVMFRLRPLS